MKHDIRVHARRPLITMNSKLKDLYADEKTQLWLKYIEPNVVRGPFGDCWIWTGRCSKRVNTKYGWEDREPTVNIKLSDFTQMFQKENPLKRVNARRFIAKMFYDFPDELMCYTLGPPVCNYSNCVNPHHIVIRMKNAIR